MDYFYHSGDVLPGQIIFQLAISYRIAMQCFRHWPTASCSGAILWLIHETFDRSVEWLGQTIYSRDWQLTSRGVWPVLGALRSDNEMSAESKFWHFWQTSRHLGKLKWTESRTRWRRRRQRQRHVHCQIISVVSRPKNKLHVISPAKCRRSAERTFLCGVWWV